MNRPRPEQLRKLTLPSNDMTPGEWLIGIPFLIVFGIPLGLAVLAGLVVGFPLKVVFTPIERTGPVRRFAQRVRSFNEHRTWPSVLVALVPGVCWLALIPIARANHPNDVPLILLRGEIKLALMATLESIVAAVAVGMILKDWAAGLFVGAVLGVALPIAIALYASGAF